MRPVQLYAVKAHGLGIRGCLRKSSDNPADFLLGHRFCNLLTGQIQPGRTDRQRVRIRQLAKGTGHADMPELRNDFAPGSMNLFHHFCPALQRGFTVDIRDILVADG
ncbi:hypothetical protein D3C86_1634770 [compost metagenome]